MAKKLPVETWVRKVSRYQSETDNSGTIARVTGYDEAGAIESTQPIEIGSVLNGEAGHYALFDEDGAVISECLINTEGERVRSRHSIAARQASPLGAAFEKAIASQIGTIGDQWANLATFQGKALTERDAQIKLLTAQVDSLKEEIAELTMRSETSEGEEWIPVLQQAIDAFAGQGQRDKLKQVAIKVISKAVEQGIIDAGNVERLLPLINSELADMPTGLRGLTS